MPDPTWNSLKELLAGGGVLAFLIQIWRMMRDWYQRVMEGRADVQVARIESDDRSEDRLLTIMKQRIDALQDQCTAMQKEIRSFEQTVGRLETSRDEWKRRAKKAEARLKALEDTDA